MVFLCPYPWFEALIMDLEPCKVYLGTEALVSSTTNGKLHKSHSYCSKPTNGSHLSTQRENIPHMSHVRQFNAASMAFENYKLDLCPKVQVSFVYNF